MVVCKFWLQGNCRYGDSCKFEHPVANNNRFGVFGAGGSGSVTTTSKDAGNTYNITENSIVKDLTEDRPQWIFSAYAPGRNAPGQLFGGLQTEQSFEELRLHFWKAASSGNQQTATNNLDSHYRQTEQRIQNAIKSPGEALRYVLNAESQHPNRLDVCKNNSLASTTGEFLEGRNRQGFTQMPFGATGASNAANPFGQVAKPSAFAANPPMSSFGQPSFGQPAFGEPSFGHSALKPSVINQTSAGQPAFGQPAFGQPSFGQPTFGQPAFGKSPTSNAVNTSSAFGQHAQLGGGSTFGQPSLLGQNASGFGAPSFGQAAGGFSKFAQPASNHKSTFGQPPQVGGTGAFGQPTQNTIGATFGQSSGMGTGTSPFAATTTAVTVSPFSKAGNSAATVGPQNVFGTTAEANTNPFGAAGQTGVFVGKPSVPVNAFAQSSITATTNSFSQQQAVTNPFKAPENPPAAGMAVSAAAMTSVGGQQTAAVPSLLNPFQQTMQITSTSDQPSTTDVFGRKLPTNAGLQAVEGASRQVDSHPAIDSYSSRDAGGRLLVFKGNRVAYQQAQDGKDTPVFKKLDGKTVKIWFPNGPPPPNKDTELSNDAYTASVRTQYEAFARTGRFEDGLVPELPPKRDWCLWDF